MTFRTICHTPYTIYHVSYAIYYIPHTIHHGSFKCHCDDIMVLSCLVEVRSYVWSLSLVDAADEAKIATVIARNVQVASNITCHCDNCIHDIQC